MPLQRGDTETATLAAALSRLQVIYSSRATEAMEGTGCRATCKRRTAQLGARVVQCAAPALRWLAATPGGGGVALVHADLSATAWPSAG